MTTHVSLHTLPKRTGRKHRRLGRGHGSGRGKTAGKGEKGQKARTGGRKGLDRLGLSQLIKHLPKQRGFRSLHASYSAVNLSLLEERFKDGDVVNLEALTNIGRHVRSSRGIKILGNGTLSKKLTVHAHAFSKSAEAAITKAGGSVVRLS